MFGPRTELRDGLTVAAKPARRDRDRRSFAATRANITPTSPASRYQIDTKPMHWQRWSGNDSSRKCFTCGYLRLARTTGLEPATTGSTVQCCGQTMAKPIRNCLRFSHCIGPCTGWDAQLLTDRFRQYFMAVSDRRVSKRPVHKPCTDRHLRRSKLECCATSSWLAYRRIFTPKDPPERLDFETHRHLKGLVDKYRPFSGLQCMLARQCRIATDNSAQDEPRGRSMRRPLSCVGSASHSVGAIAPDNVMKINL